LYCIVETADDNSAHLSIVKVLVTT